MQHAAETVRVVSALKARERALGGAFMAQADSQLTALVEAVAALAASGIDAALIGGIAVGIRSAVPRATLDIDLAALSTRPRGEIVDTLAGAGFAHLGSHPHSENFRHGNGEPVQVAIDPAFDAVIARAEETPVGGTTVRIVTTEDLLAMKRRAAADPSRRRSKALRDLADIALLEGDVGQPDEGW